MKCALKTRTTIHQDHWFGGELCQSWAVPCRVQSLVPSPHLCQESLPSAPFWKQNSLTHQPALWQSSLPHGSVVTQGVQGSGGQHCCGGTSTETAKHISQRITQMSLQLRAWKKDKNILKKAVYRHLENDKEMSKNQHGCTRNKLCQTDLIFFLWQSE